MEFDKELHYQHGTCLGMFLMFVSNMFPILSRFFHQALFVYRHIEVAETWPVTMLSSCWRHWSQVVQLYLPSGKPRSGISPPQPLHFMTQVTEWPALQQQNVHIISEFEFQNPIEGLWRIVFLYPALVHYMETSLSQHLALRMCPINYEVWSRRELPAVVALRTCSCTTRMDTFAASLIERASRNFMRFVDCRMRAGALFILVNTPDSTADSPTCGAEFV